MSTHHQPGVAARCGSTRKAGSVSAERSTPSSRLLLEELEIRPDPRVQVLAELRSALPLRGRARRRAIAEIGHHLDDCVDELRAQGLAEDEAIEEAVARLGKAETIARGFYAVRRDRRLSGRRIASVPIAWVAVGAMSIVTLLAAELPQASGAKAPASRSPTTATLRSPQPDSSWRPAARHRLASRRRS